MGNPLGFIKKIRDEFNFNCTTCTRYDYKKNTCGFDGDIGCSKTFWCSDYKQTHLNKATNKVKDWPDWKKQVIKSPILNKE